MYTLAQSSHNMMTYSLHTLVAVPAPQAYPSQSHLAMFSTNQTSPPTMYHAYLPSPIVSTMYATHAPNMPTIMMINNNNGVASYVSNRMLNNGVASYVSNRMLQ